MRKIGYIMITYIKINASDCYHWKIHSVVHVFCFYDEFPFLTKVSVKLLFCYGYK